MGAEPECRPGSPGSTAPGLRGPSTSALVFTLRCQSEGYISRRLVCVLALINEPSVARSDQAIVLELASGL